MRMKLIVSQLCIDEDDSGDEEKLNLCFEMSIRSAGTGVKELCKVCIDLNILAILE